MATDVSGFGLVLSLIASNTFPAGFLISQFADDADPFDVPPIVIKDATMGANGDLITWSKAVPIKVAVNVIAGSEDDSNLSAVLEANRVGRGKLSAQDTITMTAAYPSGNILTLTQGVMTGGATGSSVSSAGRVKTKNFTFTFENRVGVGA